MTDEFVWSYFRNDGGEILPYQVTGPHEWALEMAEPGTTPIAGPLDHLSQRVDIETGQVVDWRPPQPESDELTDYEWNEDARRWQAVPTLYGLKRIVIGRLKIERDTRLEGGFTWDGSRFDSDAAVSQSRLLGLFTTAIAGGLPESGYPWRLADNSWRILSAQDAVQVWGAFQAHMAGLFAAFAAHEGAVLALDDADALRSYDTGAGWPE